MATNVKLKGAFLSVYLTARAKKSFFHIDNLFFKGIIVIEVNMNNILIENVAFADYEDWKRDTIGLLGDHRVWEKVEDQKLEQKLDSLSEEEFIPSVYRKAGDGKWEVDILHAYFSQLPERLQREHYNFAEKAIFHVEQFGKGLSRSYRVNKCFSNAQTMLSAMKAPFEGEFEMLLQKFNEEKASKRNFVFSYKNAQLFTRLDDENTIYGKVYGMTKTDYEEYKEACLFNRQREYRNALRGDKLDNIVARGEKVIPQHLHGLWEKCCYVYQNDKKASLTLLKVLHLLERLDKGEDFEKVIKDVDRDDLLEQTLLVKFSKNSNEFSDELNIVINDDYQENE